MTERGVVLFAHGARDPRWAEPFERLRAIVAARRPEAAVALAFLESMPPDLATASREMASKGVKRLRVVPLFFGRGGHLREDFPRQVAQARAAAPGVDFEILGAAGEDEAVVEALADFALVGLA